MTMRVFLFGLASAVHMSVEVEPEGAELSEFSDFGVRVDSVLAAPTTRSALADLEGAGRPTPAEDGGSSSDLESAPARRPASQSAPALRSALKRGRNRSGGRRVTWADDRVTGTFEQTMATHQAVATEEHELEMPWLRAILGALAGSWAGAWTCAGEACSGIFDVSSTGAVVFSPDGGSTSEQVGEIFAPMAAGFTTRPHGATREHNALPSSRVLYYKDQVEGEVARAGEGYPILTAHRPTAIPQLHFTNGTIAVLEHPVLPDLVTYSHDDYALSTAPLIKIPIVDGPVTNEDGLIELTTVEGLAVGDVVKYNHRYGSITGLKNKAYYKIKNIVGNSISLVKKIDEEGEPIDYSCEDLPERWRAKNNSRSSFTAISASAVKEKAFYSNKNKDGVTGLSYVEGDSMSVYMEQAARVQWGYPRSGAEGHSSLEWAKVLPGAAAAAAASL